LKLYKQYINSLNAFERAVRMAWKKWKDKGATVRKEDPTYVLKGIVHQSEGYIFNLNMVRRFYERDSYNYFNYRPHFSSPMPSATRGRIMRGHLKDSLMAQLYGEQEKSEEMLKKEQDIVETLVLEVWKRYKKSPDPKSDALKKELMTALAVAQGSGVISSDIEEIVDEVGRF
jgi:cation transport regulator ChaB